MYYLRPIVLLTLGYLALTANPELLNIVAGLIVASLVVLLIRPRSHRVNWRQFPQAALALLRYVLVLVYDLVVSGIQVARIVLNPSLPIKPGIITATDILRTSVKTVALDGMSFIRPVKVGDILCVYTKIQSIGHTSIEIHVEAWVQRDRSRNTVKVTEASFKFVALGIDGRPRPIK